MKKKILVGYPLQPARREALSREFHVDCPQTVENRHEEIKEMVGDYHALMILGTSGQKEVLERGKKLEIVGNYGVGYDNIDIAYAKAKGIAVTNTPNSTHTGTATLAMGLILALLRKIVSADRKLRNNTHPRWGSPEALGTAPEGLTLGIIGMGRIGKALAKRAGSFDMKIQYHNRNRLPIEEEQKYEAQFVTLKELVQQSDVISVNCPLNDSTRGLIGSNEFQIMKPSTFIINTSRGGVIDQSSLIAALQQNQIAGAGLDVFWNEPEIPDVLKTLDNVVLTPHNGTGTVEDRKAMFEECFGNITAFLKGEAMTSRVV